MELTKKTGTGILILILFSLLVYAAEQKVFVDTNFNTHNLYNATNITAVLYMGNGSLLTGITGIGNSTEEIFNAVDNNTFLKQTSAVNWTQLNHYPAACPANTYLTQLDDAVTCTGITDIYLLNTGDNATGNYNFTGNITQGHNYYKCYGDSCEAYQYYNGTTLITKVN